MGTSNFHNANASKVFAVLMDANPDDSDWAYNDLKSDLLERLSQLPEFTEGRGQDQEALHSYPSNLMGTFERSKYIGGIEVCVSLVAVIRSGYYEGANLDYCINTFLDGYSSDRFRVDYPYYSKYPGICLKHAAIAQAWAADTLASMRTDLEKVYAEISMPLTVVGRASNGETFYSK